MCSCGYCCKWEWGVKLPGCLYLGLSPSWLPLKLRRRRMGSADERLPLVAKCVVIPIHAIDRGISRTDGRVGSCNIDTGQPQHCRDLHITASPPVARPAILSGLSLMQYQKIPGRLLLFPWRLLPRRGSIAADTEYYPFGTRMFVPGYGWGEVEDRGAAIKGPTRIDLYHHSHQTALKWGRRKLQVLIVLPGQSTLDGLRIPKVVKSVLKGLNWLRSLLL